MLVCAQPTWVACIVRLSLSIERHCSARPQNIRAALPQAEAFARTTSDGEIPFFAMDFNMEKIATQCQSATGTFSVLHTSNGSWSDQPAPPASSPTLAH